MPPVGSEDWSYWTTHQSDRDNSKEHPIPRASPNDRRPMQRKTPLRAKQGFKKRGGKLKPVSDRRKVLNKEYASVRREYLLSNPRCGVCGGGATDIHHKSKRGKNLSNKDTFMAVCRICHNRIHDNPAWAKEMGYLIYEY
jgi:5-methylcytosine-specific restriction endonuclease McrA